MSPSSPAPSLSAAALALTGRQVDLGGHGPAAR